VATYHTYHDWLDAGGDPEGPPDFLIFVSFLGVFLIGVLVGSGVIARLNF
jgi:hypothetical protein